MFASGDKHARGTSTEWKEKSKEGKQKKNKKRKKEKSKAALLSW